MVWPISIHAPREGSDDLLFHPFGELLGNFYPRSPRGERPSTAGLSGWSSTNFYPRSPRGERRSGRQAGKHRPQHFYPRSPRGERPGADGLAAAYSRISIHAPREGSDQGRVVVDHVLCISIHAPREGSDKRWVCPSAPLPRNFYPRSPRGERHFSTSSGKYTLRFLSTLPARGATKFIHIFALFLRIFLSTLPARGATRQRRCGRAGVQISIHAPREGSDLGWRCRCDCGNISIHAPREGSDGGRPGAGRSGSISIHAPREGSDLSALWTPCGPKNFYPRSPRGERPRVQHEAELDRKISIHAPREGSDQAQRGQPGRKKISIHAPREGSD